MPQQGPLAGRPNPGEIVQDRSLHRPVPANPVVLDREPVRLISDPLKELKGTRLTWKEKRPLAAGHVYLLEPLREADDRDALFDQLPDRGHATGELPLAAVDHHQSGDRGEARVARGVVRGAVTLLEELPQPPRQHLAHRREVVLAPLEL